MIATLSSTDGTPNERAIRGAAVAMIVPSRFSMKNAPATRSATPSRRVAPCATARQGLASPPAAAEIASPRPPRLANLDLILKATSGRSRPTRCTPAGRG